MSNLNDNDQFEYHRTPLRPLPYSRKAEAVTKEFLIDYDGNQSFHMYIADKDDPTILHDLTQLIIEEILPEEASINANNFLITIPELEAPITLQDILNFIYNRFVYPENKNGYDPERDIDKILGSTTKSIILQGADNTYYLPVTLASNVFDNTGESMQDKINNMTQFTMSTEYLRANEDNQRIFTITFPYENYTENLEVRVGTVYVDKTRYSVTPITDSEGNFTQAYLTFNNTFDANGVESGRRVDILYYYNVLKNPTGKYTHISGHQIADGTIRATALEKISDMYTLDDSSTVASSKGLYNLYSFVADGLSQYANNCIWCLDSSTSASTFEVNTDALLDLTKPIVINLVTKVNKSSTIGYTIHLGEPYNKTYSVYRADGTSFGSAIKANKSIRFLIDGANRKAYMISGNIDGLTRSRFIYTCRDAETTISYHGLSYSIDSVINVYRNGVRLFEDLDYSINTSLESITLFVRTEDGERIVFEAISYS